MAKKVQPSAAYFEDYDDNTGDVVSGTRQSANIAAKLPKSSELGPFDFASDSGYSSRTATTGTSGQSRASGRPGPSPLTVNTATNSRSFQQQQQPSPPLATRVKESRKEKGKPKEDKRISAEMMHMERLRNANGMAVPGRSTSKSQRRESVSLQHQPEMCWQCANGFHHGVNGVHSAPPMDPLSVNGYPGYYYSQAPPVQNVPPASPQAAQFYPYGRPDVLIAHSSHRQRRASRSTAYHPDGNGRPVSYHGGGQESMYNTGPLPMNHYDQGPPSAYSSYYAQSSTPRQQYYAEPGSTFQAIYERSRSSMSRPKEHRRSSIYARPTVEHSPAKASYEDGSFLERHVSREQRPRRMSQSQRQPEPYDEAEAFYRGMPPPPPPQPKPKIIQKRQDLAPKQMGNGSMPPPTSRRMSHSRDSWDMSELKHALPNQQVRPIQAAPERSRSTRTRRTSYHESDPSREIAIENPRRRRAQYHEDEPSSRQLPTSDLEQKHRNAEEYQAAKSGRSSTAGVALTEDALRLKSKINQQRLDSDSGSQKTRSNSSRGSDARTRDGSGVGSRIEDDNSFTMTMHGMTIGFTQESVNGKRIHLRADDNGAIGLNIEGRRPRRYILPPGSDYTGISSKKEIEDGRRAREERRSDRASRRSSRSTYSGRFD